MLPAPGHVPHEGRGAVQDHVDDDEHDDDQHDDRYDDDQHDDVDPGPPFPS